MPSIQHTEPPKPSSLQLIEPEPQRNGFIYTPLLYGFSSTGYSSFVLFRPTDARSFATFSNAVAAYHLAYHTSNRTAETEKRYADLAFTHNGLMAGQRFAERSVSNHRTGDGFHDDRGYSRFLVTIKDENGVSEELLFDENALRQPNLHGEALSGIQACKKRLHEKLACADLHPADTALLSGNLVYLSEMQQAIMAGKAAGR